MSKFTNKQTVRNKGCLINLVAGKTIVITVLVAVVLYGIVIIAGNVANDTESGGSPSPEICCTKCVWFKEKICGTNVEVGWCFANGGLGWGCGDIVCGNCEDL